MLTWSNVLLSAAILWGLFKVLARHLQKQQLYKMIARFPGPLTFPVIGNALDILGFNGDILNNTIKLSKTYTSPFRLWLGGNPVLFVHDAEQVKIILLKELEKDKSYQFFRDIFGDGLFTAIVSTWKINRKKIEHTFNARIIESFIAAFATQSNIMVKLMQNEVNGEEFDIRNYVQYCTLDMISETAIGVRINAQTERNGRLVESIERISEHGFKRIFQIWLHSDLIFYSTYAGKLVRESINYIFGFVDNVIQTKKEVNSKGDAAQDNNSGVFNEHQKGREPFLDSFIHNETEFTDQQLRDEVITIALAGSDTTVNVVSFTLLMLAMHQDVQDKVYEELCAIFGHDEYSEDELVTKEQLRSMEYLERVIMETMRIFPVAPLIGRRITEDLHIGEYTLPKKSSAIIMIMALHRSEKYWPNPLKFDPDRFLPDEAAKRDPYCYIPFSSGPRNCLGKMYAMLSMKTLLATVLRQYVIKKDDIVPIEDIKVKTGIVLKPVHPIKIRIEKRK